MASYTSPLGALLIGAALWIPSGGAAVAAEATAAAPTVKLLDSGKAPKRALRLDVKAGFEQSVVMTMGMTMEMSMGERSMPAFKSPSFRVPMQMKVTEVSSDGDVHYTFSYEKPEMDTNTQAQPGAVEAMTAALREMEGIRGKVIVSNRGLTKSTELSLPPDANPRLKQLLDSLKQSMSQISMPLPVEPVGEGAKWEISTELVHDGAAIRQLTRYDLKALEGDACKFAVEVKQTAGRQKIQPAGLPPGTAVELVSMSSEGKGQTDFHLARLGPTTATLSMNSATKMLVSAGEEKNEMTMKLDMEMKVEAQ